MAVKGIYGAGKSSGMINKGVSHNMGKSSGLASRTSVCHSNGKSSGTARGGDPKSCAPQGNGKGKSC